MDAGQENRVDKNQRIKDIVNLLRQHSFVKIKELKERLRVSEMTVRRDLSLLANDQVVKLIPGGAVILRPSRDSDGDKYVITHEETVRTREKINIGQKAASLIEPRDAIILDIGSTTEYVAKFMREDVPLTVLCCTINILVEIYRKRNCSVIFPGGYFHPDELVFESPEGVSLIKRSRADKAFVSAAGVHKDLGVTTVYPYELEIKKAIMQSAKTKILLVDSSKFGKAKSEHFADLYDFDIVITDGGIPQEYAEAIRARGIELLIT